jgi:UTP-glucose-1-phosphate uridylyltransferase
MIRNPSKYICGIFEKQLALEAKLHTKKKTHVKKHQRHHPLMISKMIVKQNQGFLVKKTFSCWKGIKRSHS